MTEVSTTTNTNLAVTIPQEQIEASKKIDAIVLQLSNNESANGFQRAFIQSSAIEMIEETLTPELMKPIMSLRGKKLGFLTDLDKDTTGYSLETVKRCVIEAILSGLEVTGNKFNILAGKMYPTKEGFTHLLSKIEGLWQDYVFNVPKKDGDVTTVEVEMKWKIKGGELQTRTCIFPIKVNSGMGADGVIGKAERKAKKLLYELITGNYITDGDVNDIEHTIVDSSSHKPKQEKKESVDSTERVDKNEKVEEAEVIEEKKELPEVPEVELIRGKAHLDKASNKADLDKRLKEVQGKYPNFPLEHYNSLLTKLA